MTDALPPHHRPGGGFQNPWGPGSQQGRIGAFLKWVLLDRPRDQTRGTDRRAAFAATHPPTTPAIAHPRADAGALTLTWIGHSSFLVQIGAQNILLDPMWSDRASPVGWAGPRRWRPPGLRLDALPPVDAIVQSHDHYDHLDAPTVRQLVRRHPAAVWVAPLGVASWLRRRGAADVRELDWWAKTTVGPLTINATPAQHFSGRRPDNRNSTLWSGWSIRGGGRSVFFVGDTGFHPVFPEIGQRLGPFDAVLMPIGAYDPAWFMGPVHINPEHAVQAFVSLASGGAVMGAMHWGTFKLTDEPMDEPPVRARAAWQRAGLDPGKLWIPSPGETKRWPLSTH